MEGGAQDGFNSDRSKQNACCKAGGAQSGWNSGWTDWYRLEAIDHNVGATWQAQQTMTLSEGLQVGGEYSGTPIDVCVTYWGEGPYAWDPCHASGTISYLDNEDKWHHWRFWVDVY